MLHTVPMSQKFHNIKILIVHFIPSTHNLIPISVLFHRALRISTRIYLKVNLIIVTRQSIESRLYENTRESHLFDCMQVLLLLSS